MCVDELAVVMRNSKRSFGGLNTLVCQLVQLSISQRREERVYIFYKLLLIRRAALNAVIGTQGRDLHHEPGFAVTDGLALSLTTIVNWRLSSATSSLRVETAPAGS